MATAIVAVAVSGMMQVVAIGAESLDTDRKQQVAAQLVATEIARLRHGDWTRIANLPSTATIAIDSVGGISGDTTSFALSNYTGAAGDDDLALSARAAGFRCSLQATRLRPASATAATVTFVHVVYTVRWTSSAGRAHSRRSEAHLGRNGLHLSYQRT